MAVPSNRALERTAINKLRLLLERHGHIVQEVPGGSDMGEDLILSFVQGKHRTSDHVAIQVKGGKSYRAAVGYSVPIRQHAGDWATTNIPVVCVVFDPAMQSLYWANATEQLAVAGTKQPKSVRIGESAVLNDATVGAFVEEMAAFTRAWGKQDRSSPRVSGSTEPVAPEDGPVGGYADNYFGPVARWIERHPEAMRRVILVMLAVGAAAALAVMTPSLYSFAEEFVQPSPPWLWVVLILGYTVVGVGAIVREARRGERPILLRLAVFFPLLVAYYAALNQEFDLGLPDVASALIGALVPQVVKYAMLFGAVYFIGREIDRRRRIRAIGNDPDQED